jgi:hypothetical protein
MTQVIARRRQETMSGTVQAHNQRPAAVWSAGGEFYDEISQGISDSIEHCVRRFWIWRPAPVGHRGLLHVAEPT